MFIVVSTHSIKPGMVAVAERRIDANGDRMEAAPGFRFRYRLTANDDPLKLTTVTAWGSENDYQGDREAARSSRGDAPTEESPYAEIVQEGHSVERVQVPAATAGQAGS